MQDELNALMERVRAAYATRAPLEICGGGSKRFLGERVEGTALDVTGYRGIIEYEPTELVLTVRAGTPLKEVQAALDERGQMLAFEAPHFGERATIGGCVAAGLSGPRRAYAGSVRDFVLGTRVIDGQGKDLYFGGKVIKNVAGYDVSRLMVGAYGTLGVITEISFKVLPKPAEEATLLFEAREAEAITLMNKWAGQPLPLSATLYDSGSLYVRLSGAASSVAAARGQLGGERVDDADGIWEVLREHKHFPAAQPLWRLSVPSTTPPLGLGPQLIEWGGALRWLSSGAEATTIRDTVEKAGGSAMLFRNAKPGTPVFHPLKPELARLNARLKQAFDPARILNPGRMYAEPN